jgi:hypothetical protein
MHGRLDKGKCYYSLKPRLKRVVGMRKILDQERTLMLVMQLADMATAAHERGDFAQRDAALGKIRELREGVKGGRAAA